MFECWSTKLGLFASRADAIPSDNNMLPPSRASGSRMVLREREAGDAVTMARWITSLTQSAGSCWIRESVLCFDISTLLSELINRKLIFPRAYLWPGSYLARFPKIRLTPAAARETVLMKVAPSVPPRDLRSSQQIREKTSPRAPPES